MDGNLQGCKEEFVLYAYDIGNRSPQQMDWRLHQYHIRGRAKDEGELVVSKIFHQSQNNPCELAEKTRPQSELVSPFLRHDSAIGCRIHVNMFP